MRSGKLFWLFLIGCCNSLFSQSNIQLSFISLYDGRVLNLLDSAFHSNDSNNTKIETLKFYISNIRLLKNGKTVFKEANSFHLIDAGNEASQLLSISPDQKIAFDELKFDLGIDSTTNVAGALGGALDPTKGMYWTWQSGYINFKLEGSSNLCNTRNNEFQFHLGGYLQPFNCLQTLSFTVINTNTINIQLDARKILQQIDLAKTNHIMSPGAEAVFISKVIANSFTVSTN